MKSVIERMDAEYEIEFSTPLFDLPTRNVEVLENLYHSLRLDHDISPSDMQAAGGTALSDVKIRIVLLGGIVAVEVMTDRMLIEFDQLEGSRDFSTYESCIVNCERVIREIYPKLCTDITNLSCTAEINISGRTIEEKLLGDSVEFGNGVDLSDFGIVERLPSVSATMLNSQQKWLSTFRADFMSPDKSDLIAFCRISYTDSGAPQNLTNKLRESKNRMTEFKKLFRVLLREAGVNSEDLILSSE